MASSHERYHFTIFTNYSSKFWAVKKLEIIAIGKVSPLFPGH